MMTEKPGPRHKAPGSPRAPITRRSERDLTMRLRFHRRLRIRFMRTKFTMRRKMSPPP